MIKVSLSDLMLIGLIIGILLVGALWVVAVFGDRRRDFRTRSTIVVCRICGCAYHNTTGGEISVCPGCDTPNERNPLDAI